MQRSLKRRVTVKEEVLQWFRSFKILRAKCRYITNATENFVTGRK